MFITVMIKKLELRLLEVLILLKVMFGHAQIRAPKMNMLLWKTACIDSCLVQRTLSSLWDTIRI